MYPVTPIVDYGYRLIFYFAYSYFKNHDERIAAVVVRAEPTLI